MPKSLFVFSSLSLVSMLRARPAAAAALTTAAACTRTALAVTRLTGLSRSRPSALLPSPLPRLSVVSQTTGQSGKMWTFAGGGRDQRSLVDFIASQRRGVSGGDVSPVAIEAMKAVDRKEFIGPVAESRANVYLVSRRRF